MSYQVAVLTGCVESPLLAILVFLVTETKLKLAIPHLWMLHKTRAVLI
jgi:hypothetical protein